MPSKFKDIENENTKNSTWQAKEWSVYYIESKNKNKSREHEN